MHEKLYKTIIYAYCKARKITYIRLTSRRSDFRSEFRQHNPRLQISVSISYVHMYLCPPAKIVACLKHGHAFCVQSKTSVHCGSATLVQNVHSKRTVVVDEIFKISAWVPLQNKALFVTIVVFKAILVWIAGPREDVLIANRITNSHHWHNVWMHRQFL